MLPDTKAINAAGFALMDKAEAMLASGNIKAGMDQLMLGLRELRNRYNARDWQAFTRTISLNHSITELIHQCPFTYHSFTKPRGYAGDAELLDFIYGFKRPSPELSALGIEIFNYCRDTTVSSSVRSRRDILAKTIDDLALDTPHPIQILSIACGHLREAQESEAISERAISRFIAFDQDPLSLELIDRKFSHRSIETVSGSVTTLVRQKQTFENLDFVYAAGLYDYLSQPFATRLTKVMFDMLRPGGKILVANFIPNHREVGYMETFMQWNLIYRTEAQLADVSQEISDSEIAQKRTFFEENGNIVFLEILKA